MIVNGQKNHLKKFMFIAQKIIKFEGNTST